MTLKELIQAEIDKIPEQELDKFYQWIREFTVQIDNIKNSETSVTSEKQLTNSSPYHDLDHLAGTWTKEDETEFLLNTQQFNEIDSQLWQ
ncbi:MAG: hypothetical protein F6K62_08510 [Sphaerospermopsis sp. SIO1G2]|nr:hypothetical protein [Sphaerospermopsis sp. SIO1G2]